MTDRKPAWVPFESFVERQIREAKDRGELDDLPGKGKPLQGLDDPDPDWWIKRKLRDEGVSLLPPALELRRDVERFFDGLARVSSEDAARAQVAALNARIVALNRTNTSAAPTDMAPLDVDVILARWRAAR